MVKAAGLVALSAVLLSVRGKLVVLDDLESTTAYPTPAPTPELVCAKGENDEPLRNTDTDLTYVIAYYGEGQPFTESENSILWPYAIDKCTALASISSDGTYGKFTCDEGDESFTFQRYEDSDCQTASEDAVSYSASDLSAPLSFNCDGSKGTSYVAIDFTAGDTTCEADAQTYGTVGVCFFSEIPPSFVNNGYSYLYCDADGSKQEFFDYNTDDQCSNDDLYCSDWVFENTCNLVFTSGAGTDFYGKMVECQSAQKDDTRADSSDSSDESSDSSGDNPSQEPSDDSSGDSSGDSSDESGGESSDSFDGMSSSEAPNSSVDGLDCRLSFFFGLVLSLLFTFD